MVAEEAAPRWHLSDESARVPWASMSGQLSRQLAVPPSVRGRFGVCSVLGAGSMRFGGE